MSASHITVIGSYAAGLTMKTERFPLSGETLLGHDFVYTHGGKGSNQAVACARQGMNVSMIACIGNDNYGQNALQLWKSEHIATDNVHILEDTPTGAGFILVNASGQNEIVVDLGANQKLSHEHIQYSKETILASDVLLMQLEIPTVPVQTALNIAKTKDIYTILNPAPYQSLSADILSSCSLITPNETEARLICGLSADTEISPDKLSDLLLARGVHSAVITLGEKGSYLLSGKCRELIPAFMVNTIDTTGAGDTFSAALASAISEKADLKEAVIYASAASAIAVTKYGVIDSLPEKKQILDFLELNK